MQRRKAKRMVIRKRLLTFLVLTAVLSAFHFVATLIAWMGLGQSVMSPIYEAARPLLSFPLDLDGATELAHGWRPRSIINSVLVGSWIAFFFWAVIISGGRLLTAV